MKTRKITSLTAFLSFIFLLMTSIILYIVPHGRVAYWSDWRLWGLSKTQWGNLHINLGVLFLLTTFLHIYYNWQPIVNYLKNSSKRLVIFTREFNIAVVLLLVFCLGTYFEIVPFRWVLDIGESIKDSAIKKYGEPPYGHAELSSLKIFTQKTGIDLAEGMEELAKAGIQFENETQTMEEIASINKTTPKNIYLIMKPSKTKNDTPFLLPENPKPGLGKLDLKNLCDEYDLDISTVLQILKKENINADAGMSIKTISEKNQVSPVDIYTIIRNNLNRIKKSL